MSDQRTAQDPEHWTERGSDLVHKKDIYTLTVRAHEHPVKYGEYIGVVITVMSMGERLDQYVNDEEAIELRDWLDDHFPRTKEGEWTPVRDS